MGEYIIQVLFLEPHPRDFILNKLTALAGQRIHGRGFCHVELCMPNPNQQGFISSSIYNGETVTMTSSKTFANPGYIVYSTTVNRAQLQNLLEFVRRSHEDRVAFDHVGMYASLLPFEIRKSSPKKTFCSKYTVEALQAAGVNCLKNINPNLTTPSKLYKILTTEGCSSLIGSVEYKQNNMKLNAGHLYMKL